MLDLPYYHVDVFSTRALRGNGLVVVLEADKLSTALMQAVTREMRQFESTFVMALDLAGRSAVLRIFTEDEELDFAGHPVLGTAAVLHAALPEAGAEQRWALTVAGRTLDVRTMSGPGHIVASMDQGMPVFGDPISGDLLAAYLGALGLRPAQLHRHLPVQVVSTGLPYLIVPVTPAGLDRARIDEPDFESLLALSGAKFVYVLEPDAPEGRTWDNAGRVEDIATGSAAGPAFGYLVRHGRFHPGPDRERIHQGRFVGRPSEIEVGLDQEGRIWVGGPVAPVAAGRFRADVG